MSGDARRGADRASRGHRARPHTADVMIEAWAPTRAECLEEAVAALADLYVDVPPEVHPVALTVTVSAPSDDEVLVAVLERAVAEADVGDTVVVAAELSDTADGVTGTFVAVPVGEVEVTGAVPKGVSRSDLELRATGSGWRARAVLDV